jgi:hypothetical protein
MALMTQVGMEFIARDRSRAGINSFNRGITNMTRSVLQLAGIGGGIYLLQRGLRSTIREASSAQETFAKFDVVFREQSDSARKWAEDFGDSVGRATHDVAGWMAGLQDTFVPLGIARDKSAELSKSLVKLAVDVASFNNRADADVIRDFTSALVGNHETVRKYGIIISENAIKQEALRQGLNKTYAQLTDLEKVQLRYNLIQAGTTDAQGDAIRTADSYANQVKRLSANWKEFKVQAGEPAIGVLASIIGKTNEAIEATKKWNESIIESRKDMTKSERMRATGAGIWGFTPEEMVRISGGGTEPSGGIVDWTGTEMKRLMDERAGQAEQSAEKVVAVETRTNAQILADTREQLKSTRALYDKTRIEKILILKRYTAAHAAELRQSAAAEKLLADEITALHLSRVDAMVVYRTKLKEDMQETALYISEKFADASRSIERSLSGAFESMIADGASFRDAMEGFFSDVGRAFAKMAADMAARAVMDAWIAPLMSGLAGGIGGLFGGGTPNAAYSKAPYPVHHQGWVPEGVPSFHGGRELKSNERVAVIEDDELIAPGRQVVRGGMGSAAPNIIIYNESGQPIAQKNEPEFDGESWVVSLIAQNYTQGGSLKKMLK